MKTQTHYEALVNELIPRITSLVYDRNLLQRRSEGTELERANAEIGRLQWRLARIVQSHQLTA